MSKSKKSETKKQSSLAERWKNESGIHFSEPKKTSDKKKK